VTRRFALYLALVILCAYANALVNDFVAGDRQFILKNQAIGNPRTLLTSFSSDYWGALGGQAFAYYRPLVILSHFIDYKLYGLNPAGHHLTNIVLHIAVALLVFRLLLELVPSARLAAFLGSLLFGLQPVQTHAVSYIMGRTDVLATLFFVAGLLCFIRAAQNPFGRAWAWLIAGACACYQLALFSKEMALTLPLVCCGYWFCWARGPADQGRARLLISLACLCATLGIYLAVRTIVVAVVPQAAFPDWYAAWQRFALVVMTAGFYLGKLLLPIKLCYYGNIVLPGTYAEALASPLLLLGVLACAVSGLLVLRRSRLGFALGWIMVTLLPVLNIVPLPFLAKENYLYLPSVGFGLLFVMLFAALEEKGARTFGVTAAVCLSLLYGLGTYWRNYDYRDPETFLQRTLQAMAEVPVAQREDVRFFEPVKNLYTTHRNLGRLYTERGEWNKAIASFEQARGYIPAYFAPDYRAEVNECLGSAYERAGRFPDAYALLSQALAGSSRPYYVSNLLGVTALKMQALDKAEFHFKEALRYSQDYAPAHHNLGMLYIGRGKRAEGEAELRRAAELDQKYRRRGSEAASTLGN
jgi:tetratricopeptide (TPR) repeat protein